MSDTNTEKKLIELIKDFDNAMLVTKTDDGQLDARPMAVADVESDGTLWFITDRTSGKVADLMLSDQVAVTMQSSNKFVTLTCTAHVVDDRKKLSDVWKEAWKVWFPDGKSDPAITLLKIEPSGGEFWDNSGVAGMKYLIKAGKAYVQGERPELDESVNASVALDR